MRPSPTSGASRSGCVETVSPSSARTKGRSNPGSASSLSDEPEPSLSCNHLGKRAGTRLTGPHEFTTGTPAISGLLVSRRGLPHEFLNYAAVKIRQQRADARKLART